MYCTANFFAGCADGGADRALGRGGARGLCSPSVVSMSMSLARPAYVLVRAWLDQGARIAEADLCV